MALILLQVLVLGVTAAAVDDVPVRWAAAPRAVLACSAAAAARRPPPPLDDPHPRPRTHFWLRDGEVYSAKRMTSNGSLEVSRKRDGDGGHVYQCGVRHQSGIVLGLPLHLKFAYMEKQFSAHPENVTVQQGQPVAISCTISSGPPASISWQKDDQDLPISSRYHILESQLLITDARTDDAGTYRCIATNQLVNRSRASHLGKLEVVETAEERNAGLLEVHYAAQITAPMGSRVVLPCAVVGWPRPKLIWKLTPPQDRSSELEQTDEVLVLQRLDIDQEGVYTCLVEGQSHLNRTFNVTVTKPVEITLPPTSKEVLRASTVRFKCSAVGKPEPVVTWYKDGKQLPLTGRFNVRTSADGSRMELVISGVTSDEAGIYQCFARGGPDETLWATAWAALNVTGASADAPGALRCRPVGPRRVALAWHPAPNVVAYAVYTTPRDTPGSALPGQPHNNTDEVITVREALTPYLFQVRAFITTTSKKNIASDMSESVVCQGQGVPIKLSKIGDSISISWRQFAEESPGVVEWVLQHKADSNAQEQNITLPGPITEYKLPGGGKSSWVRVLGSRSRRWLAQELGLLPWTDLAAANHPPSKDVTAAPQEVRVSEVGIHGFTVKWRFEENNSSLWYSFRICIKRKEEPEDCQESYKSSATVDGLLPDTEYEVRIQAVAQGRASGAFSEPLKVTTQQEVPSDVGELSYSVVNASAVVVRWRGGGGGGGGADAYTVRHSSRLRLPVDQWTAFTTTDTHALITGLEPTEPTYVMVSGREPHGRVLTIPAQARDLEAKDLSYVYTITGVKIWWKGSGLRTVRYAQNITRPVEHWPSVNVTEPIVELAELDPSLPVYVMVAAPGPGRPHQVLTIAPRPDDAHHLYINVGVGVGVAVLCLSCVCAAVLWRRRHSQRTRTHLRTRKRNQSGTEDIDEDGSALKEGVGGRLANGGASARPLLNGHPHHHAKAPNGRPRPYEAFDVSRDEPAETSLQLLDTSRPPPPLHKLPDDNMNSELRLHARASPTLQPNG